MDVDNIPNTGAGGGNRGANGGGKNGAGGAKLHNNACARSTYLITEPG